MILRIDAENLGRLLEDLRPWYRTEETISIAWIGAKSNGKHYFRVNLNRYQVKILKKALPVSTIEEKYESV